MKIGSLAPWYGGKRNLAPRIVEALGPHRVYWEPFCGSCSVLFSKPRVTYETVNDLHQDLVNLALVVQAADLAEELHQRVQRCIFHEALLPIAKVFLTGRELAPGVPDVERAYWYLVFSWMGMNGISGTPLSHTGTFACRYSGRGGNGATRWRSVVDSLPDWHQRLLGVQILGRDGFDVLARIDDEVGTTIYLDPPYITKGARYVHDFAAEEHGRLAALAGRFRRARVVVSYYDDPLLAEFYPAWSRIECPVAKSMVNSGKRRRGYKSRTTAEEVLLVNQPTRRGLFE